jgi:hypothetical protein
MDRILAVGGPASKLLCSRAVRLSAEDVLAALAKGEGTRREFKRTLPRDDKVARTLCAFANTRGGLLLVGVTDRKRVHGVHRADDVAGELERHPAALERLGGVAELAGDWSAGDGGPAV